MGLLKQLRLFGCAHQFSWPRHSPDGQAYQVCLVCGAEYLYDWASMRRRGRISNRKRPAGRSGRDWQARARRLIVETPVRFRPAGANDEWCDGTIRNISKSGVLIEAERVFTVDSQVEIVFAFPRELSLIMAVSGTVAAQGRVVRLDPARHRMGVTVLDWASSACRPPA